MSPGKLDEQNVKPDMQGEKVYFVFTEARMPKGFSKTGKSSSRLKIKLTVVASGGSSKNNEESPRSSPSRPSDKYKLPELSGETLRVADPNDSKAPNAGPEDRIGKRNEPDQIKRRWLRIREIEIFKTANGHRKVKIIIIPSCSEELDCLFDLLIKQRS